MSVSLSMSWRRGAGGLIAVAIALTAVSILAAPLPASAAEATIRPELYPRAAAMKRLFPARSLAGTEGTRAENDDTFTGLDAFPAEAITGQQPAVLRIEGQIEKGDAEKVRKLLEDWTYYPLIVSFDSPGGVFAEAFRIAEVLRYDIESQDPRIAGLIVLAGDECLSACAVAFAASVDRVHPDVDSRFIETGGKLGFHMPYIPEGTDTSTAGAREMLGLGYDVAAQMVALLEGGANPPELLLRMLRHRTASSFYVLEGDLEAWRMGFSPVAPKEEVIEIGVAGLDTATIGQLCNLSLRAGSLPMSAAQDEFTQFQRFDDEGNLEQVLLTTWMKDGSRSFDIGGGWFSCQARVDDRSRIGIGVRDGDPSCGGTAEVSSEAVCAAPARAVDAVSNFFLAEAYSCRRGEILPDTFSDESRPRIKRDVYLRDAPGRAGQVVTTLAAGSEVVVTGCRVTTDDQGVWYAVSRPGAKGWVSARFVGGHVERFSYRGGPRFAIDPPEDQGG